MLTLKSLLSVFTAVLCLSAVYAKNPAIENARKLLLENRAACVLLDADGKTLMIEKGRGVSPLLTIYDARKGDMKNTIVVDKVIGKATAAIAVCGKVKHVHAEVMSKRACDLLKKHKITYSCTLLVPEILNRKRDGLCPMEQTVMKIDDPVQAMVALRRKLVELRRKK